jgi:hypothetical protein
MLCRLAMAERQWPISGELPRLSFAGVGRPSKHDPSKRKSRTGRKSLPVWTKTRRLVPAMAGRRRVCSVSSNPDEIRRLGVAPVRPARMTALHGLLAGAKQAVSKRLQSRSVGIGAAPELTPKRNSETIRTAAGPPTVPRCTSLANWETRAFPRERPAFAYHACRWYTARPSRQLRGYAVEGLTSTRSIRTSVPRRTELGISAIASTCSMSALSCSGVASPVSSTS